MGMPFREAHDTVGRIVIKAIELGRELHELPLETMQGFSPLIGEGVFDALSLDQTLASKGQRGGTSPGQVREALREARESLQLN
jgi:argininosuccinate lyase